MSRSEEAFQFDLEVKRRLDAFDLAVRLRSDAVRIGLRGPSGSGKSTLIRVLAGVDAVARGRVVVGGRTWLDAEHLVPPWDRPVGWVPQEALIFPHLSVRDNLRFGGEEVPLGQVAELLEIASLLDRRPDGLSGGERLRVALGRALVANPVLLLLDEPFAALDEALRSRVARRLSDWMSEREMSLVLATHHDPGLDGLVTEWWGLEKGVASRL